MHRSDFSYDLPVELIAQTPLAERTASRLLCLDGNNGDLAERSFRDLTRLLRPGDLLIFNDTRVVPARLFGRKASGGRVELLLERILDTQRFLVQLRASKPPQPGSLIDLDEGVQLLVLGRSGEFYELRVAGATSVEDVLERCGKLPLPPYITRQPDAADAERYQTVFARHRGAVAAPTAGLHFDTPLLDQIKAQGVELGFVTLHVGAGTFQPLRTETLEAHRMHSEHYVLAPRLAEQVQNARRAGGRIVAVGTTVVRVLETLAEAGGLVRAGQGVTNIFIYPGYRFQVADVLITNFHLPESTLLMLVCAFAGKDQVLHAYRHAVARQFRFFSYGDAMWVTRRAV